MSSKGRAKKAPALQPVKVTGNWLLAASVAALVLSVTAAYILVRPANAASSASASRRHADESVRIVHVDSTKVFVVDNFFSDELVAEWRRLLKREWDEGRWFYTSNNNGQRDDANLNRKVVSRRLVAERQAVARQMLSDDVFAYSKWELERNNSVHLAMLAHLELPATRERVAAIVGTKKGIASKMGDFFVTLYKKGDFLSAHSDIYGGTYATVIHLAEKASEQSGGELSFFCASSGTWCQKIAPAPNRLILFRTRSPAGPPHRVKTVRSDTFFRWSATGWFDEVGEHFSAHDLEERNKMRHPVIDR